MSECVLAGRALVLQRSAPDEGLDPTTLERDWKAPGTQLCQPSPETHPCSEMCRANSFSPSQALFPLTLPPNALRQQAEEQAQRQSKQCLSFSALRNSCIKKKCAFARPNATSTNPRFTGEHIAPGTEWATNARGVFPHPAGRRCTYPTLRRTAAEPIFECFRHHNQNKRSANKSLKQHG